RVVLADADARTRLEARAALAHDDLAAAHELPRERLDAEALSVGVASVAARSEPLLMSHLSAPPPGSRPVCAPVWPHRVWPPRVWRRRVSRPPVWRVLRRPLSRVWPPPV